MPSPTARSGAKRMRATSARRRFCGRFGRCPGCGKKLRVPATVPNEGVPTTAPAAVYTDGTALPSGRRLLFLFGVAVAVLVLTLGGGLDAQTAASPARRTKAARGKV